MISRKKGKCDTNQLSTYFKNQSKILNVIKYEPKGLSRSELKAKTGLSYASIRKHLNQLILKGEIKEYNEKIFWLHWYHRIVGNTSEAYSQELQKILAIMTKPESIYQIQREGAVRPPERFPVNTDPDAPAQLSFLTVEEWQEFVNHKQKVFGELRKCFFELARFLMKADVGFIHANDDLSNVTVNFENGQAQWTVDPRLYKG